MHWFVIIVAGLIVAVVGFTYLVKLLTNWNLKKD